MPWFRVLISRGVLMIVRWWRFLFHVRGDIQRAEDRLNGQLNNRRDSLPALNPPDRPTSSFKQMEVLAHK